MRHALILVGGIPGSGKSYIGKQLARRIGLYVDKDTVANRFTEKTPPLLGSIKDDRQSAIHLDNVRDIEYEAMMAQAFENLALGVSVVCSAPFFSEFANPKWIADVTRSAKEKGAELYTLWVRADLETARKRLIARGESRDEWKLANWHFYTQGLSLYPHPHAKALVIENSGLFHNEVMAQINVFIERIESIAQRNQAIANP